MLSTKLDTPDARERRRLDVLHLGDLGCGSGFARRFGTSSWIAPMSCCGSKIGAHRW
jgi:hypothetical protein